jgi:putative transposase
VICRAVSWYHDFGLNLREVELILTGRGIVVTHDSIWHWWVGTELPACQEARSPRTAARRHQEHRDEAFIHIQVYCTLRGEWRVSTVLCWTFWCRTDEMAQLLSVFRQLLRGLQYEP